VSLLTVYSQSNLGQSNLPVTCQAQPRLSKDKNNHRKVIGWFRLLTLFDKSPVSKGIGLFLFPRLAVAPKGHVFSLPRQQYDITAEDIRA
jgi:hypothetical protein